MAAGRCTFRQAAAIMIGGVRPPGLSVGEDAVEHAPPAKRVDDSLNRFPTIFPKADVVRELITTFREKFGARPFANLQD